MNILMTRKMWVGAWIGATSIVSLSAQAGVGGGHLAMWSFNGESYPPVTITDKSGKANNGTPTDINIWPDSYGGDYYGQWWSQKSSDVAGFNGATSFIQVTEAATVANSTALRLSASPFTIAVWTRLEPTDSESNSYPLVNKPGWSLSISTDEITYIDWQEVPVDYDEDGEVDYWEWAPVETTVPAGSAKFCSGTTCIESPYLPELLWNWVNIAVTYNNTSKQAILYVNGIQQALSGPTPAFPAPLATAGNLLIGKSQDGLNFFQGSMDDVRIYNRVLSSVATATAPNEILELGKGCAPATFTPSTGKVIVPCVVVTAYYPPAYYYAELQQGISAGGDVNVPAIDDVSFGIPVAPKAIVASATNPEPVWGSAVGAYSGDMYYGEPLEDGADKYLLSGWLNLPLVSVVSPVANPKTECYGVYLDQIFANNRFVLVDWDGLSYLGPDCNDVSTYYYAGAGQEGAADGEGAKPKPHREIPKPPPVQ